MAVLADAKTVSAPFHNKGELVRVRYSFAADTGAIADYDVLIADGNLLVQLLNVDVKAAVTSDGAVAFDLGKGAGGTEWWSDKVKAALTLDLQSPGSLTLIELSDGEKIVLGLEAAAATAGIVEFQFMIYSR